MNEGVAVEARGLTRRFGRLVAVDGLDLTIPRGRIFGFLGPNGSGKTTTIRMLCGLLRPSAGEAVVLGYSMPREAESLRSKIGYMTQRFTLYEDLTVRENLEFMSDIHSLARPLRRRRIAELLEHYRLGDRADQRAVTLSGGQRQRLALAAALLPDPQLLFLDEPTSAVDPANRREFWESLFELSDRGTTILVSTHYMDEAERCHALVILDRGRLRAAGSPRDLLDDLAATVLEVESAELRRVREQLTGSAGVIGVAQLGGRLRVLVELAVESPLERVRSLLAREGVEARVEIARPSLEDVFVMSTRSPSEPTVAVTGAAVAEQG